MPDLSVCITTYNLYNYIDETLESVMNQRTKYSVEILIGDDGSTDGTIEKIMEWQAKYPGLIRYYQVERDPNKKYNFIFRAAQNRINLMKYAQGKYINFLDGDDLYKHDNFYESAINILEDPNNSDCMGCCGKTEMFFPDGHTQLLGNISVGKISLQDYWESSYTHSEATIYRNNIDVDIRYLDYFDDNMIMFLAFKKGKLYCMPDIVASYRQKEGAFLTRPLLEQCLYGIIDYDVECGIYPTLQSIIAKRHAVQFYTVQQNIDNVTIEKYPEIFQLAVSMRANTLINVFENNVAKSKQEAKDEIKKIVLKYGGFDFAIKNVNYLRQVHLKENRKIKVVFLCYRPAVWVTYKSIYEECIKDEAFDITIVAIPVREYITNQYIDEGAEEYFKKFSCRVINGYDKKNDSWFSLEQLEPDYVFYLQPYNLMLPSIYNTSVVRNYAKICYSPYGVQVIGEYVEESVYPQDFMCDLSYLFMDDGTRIKWIVDKISKEGILLKDKVLFYGYPRYDNLDDYRAIDSISWKYNRCEERYRIIWTPRWATEEGNCNFFDYKDLILEYAQQRTNDVEVLFRPHPEMWKNFTYKSKEMSVEEQEKYKNKYYLVDNAAIDTQQDYMNTFFTSDVLLTDASSIMMDYLFTGKPIIYCHKEKDIFTQIGWDIYNVCYIANNWEEVQNILDKLRLGNDPLLEKRKELINRFVNKNSKTAGYYIKECLKRDFYSS